MLLSALFFQTYLLVYQNTAKKTGNRLIILRYGETAENDRILPSKTMRSFKLLAKHEVVMQMGGRNIFTGNRNKYSMYNQFQL